MPRSLRLLLIFLLGAGLAAGGLAPTHANVPQEDFDREVIRLVNQERTSRGLPPLREWAALRDARSGAVEWSQTMYRNREERVGQKKYPYYHDWDHVRAGNRNALCAGGGGNENVAMPGNRTPQGLVNLYMGSADHRNQILSTRLQYVASGTVSDGIDLFNTMRFAATCDGFSDIDADHQFVHHIVWLANNGITTGYQDGTFRPGSPIQRQAVAAFLYRYAQATRNETPNYRDVPPDHQFARHIEWAQWSGITTGYQDGTFRPESSIQRQAVAAFLYRLAGSPAVELPAQSPFSDVPANHQFYRQIIWLTQNSITTGYQDGTFRPEDPIQRQALAAFLYRYDVNLMSGSLVTGY